MLSQLSDGGLAEIRHWRVSGKCAFPFFAACAKRTPVGVAPVMFVRAADAAFDAACFAAFPTSSA